QLQGSVAALNGGIAAGIQMWNERLVLNGPGQQVAVAAAGTFRLSFNGSAPTNPLSVNAAPGLVQAELNALSTISGVGGSVTVTRTGNVYTIVFGGTLAGGANPLLQYTIVSGNALVTVTGADNPLQNLSDDNMWRGPVTLATTTSIDVAANSRLSLFGAIDDAANPAPG